MAAKSAPIPGPPGIQATLPEHGLIAVAWAGVAVAGAFLAARTAVRISIIGRLGGDDYWLYFGFLVFLVNAVLQTLQTPSVYFVSRLIRNLESDPVEIGKQGNIYVRYEFAIIGFFWTVLWCVKASFLSLYYNLFQGLGAGQRRIWWFVAVFTGLAYAGCWIASILVCIPAYTYFEFGKCSNPTGSAIAIIYSTGVDVLTDIMIMLLPLNLIRRLNVSSKQKAGLILCFCLAGVIMVVAVVRCANLLNGSTQGDQVLLALWGLIESTVSLVIGCLPSFKALFSRRATSAGSSPYSPWQTSRSKSRPNQSGSHPLQYIGNTTKASNKRDTYRSDSQEGMVAPAQDNVDPGLIMVRKDFTVITERQRQT